jgi:hypothetical protein
LIKKSLLAFFLTIGYVQLTAADTPIPAGACVEGSTGCDAVTSTSTPVPVSTGTPTWQKQLEQVKQSSQACEKEVDRYCEGIQVGHGRIENCLKAHRKQLSKHCRDSIFPSSPAASSRGSK